MSTYSAKMPICQKRLHNDMAVTFWDLATCMQVEFSRDGNYLYTGARRDSDIFCWDIRYTSDVVYRLQRDSADTNQRIQFNIEPLGRHLATGRH